jgi:protein SCO1
MRRVRPILVVLLLLATTRAWSAQQYPASGLVIRVDRPSRTMVVSCNAIPDFMEAMAMPFSVRDAKELEGLAPGTMIEFTLVVEKDSSHAEKVHIRPFESLAQEPQQVRRMTLLQSILDPQSVAVVLTPGQHVPDFTLTDQSGRNVSFHEFAGKVVALDFVYTRCPLPDYCYRFSNHFGQLQRRFGDHLGRDLVLLTLTFDPIHDRPENLAAYAKTWKANPAGWRFLTGSPDDIKRICGWFGVGTWSDEALLTHSLRTVVIDRQGNLFANIEGNTYTAEQLGDLLEAAMELQPGSGTPTHF